MYPGSRTEGRRVLKSRGREWWRKGAEGKAKGGSIPEEEEGSSPEHKEGGEGVPKDFRRMGREYLGTNKGGEGVSRN